MSVTMTTTIPTRRVMSLQSGPPRTSSLKSEPRFGKYVLGQTLGEGEFGKVKLGWPSTRDGNRDNVQVAIKLIRRESVGHSRSRLNKIEREINVLRTVHHPNIVKCYEVIETERHIGIILEYASGGELFDFILAHRYLKDAAASRLFAQLVSAVQYLHNKGIVHRDLKLENLLLDRNRNIIVTDFGFANTFQLRGATANVDNTKTSGLVSNETNAADLMQTSCGSPCYAAPELVVSDGSYCGRKVDVWSCGVILYAMLAGYLPFDDDPSNPEGDNISLLYKYIVTTPLTFPEYISPLARDLLRCILVPDPKKRASLANVINHAWLAAHARTIEISAEAYRGLLDHDSAAKPQSEKMERSASERPASHTTFALPLANHLVPTGFNRNTSMGPPSGQMAVLDKRHTVQIGHDRSQPTPYLQRSEQQVETLSIPAAPTMARSASHTGASIAASGSKPLPKTSPIQAGTYHGSHNRPHTKLPGPSSKPRPTSYHPTSLRTPVISEHPVDSLGRVGSSGSTTSRNSTGIWPPGNNYQGSKTASPRSTRQNASGEIYSSAGGSTGSAITRQLTNPPLDLESSGAGHQAVPHRRSASISGIFGKFWPVAMVQDGKARRTSEMFLTKPMNPIGENALATPENSMPASKVSEGTTENRSRRASQSATTNNLASTSGLSNVARLDETPQNRANGTSNLRLTANVPMASTHKRSSSTAKRMIGFFTSRRKEASHV